VSIFSNSGNSNQNNSLRNNLMREMIAPQSSLDANPKAKLLPIEKLISNPFQVRQDFDTPEANAALEELAADISEHGILQPILVRPAREPGKFEIVAGERRYRAAQIASLKQLPAIVDNFNDKEARLVSLTENLQRRDLNFKEEVDFLAQLNEKRIQEGFGGETDLARLIHKSRTFIAKRLKLAPFPDLVERVITNQISINHAYTEALDREQLQMHLPFEKEASNESEIGEEMHNVFPGNTFSLNDLAHTNENVGEKEGTEAVKSPRMSLRASFRAKIVPFSRARDALKSLAQDFEKFEEEERVQLKVVLEELEQTLVQLRAKL